MSGSGGARFKQIPLFTQQIGVQVTARTNDISKQEEFLRIHQSHAPTPRTVYLELDPEVIDVDGAAQAAYAALVSLVLDRSHETDTIVGLRIAKNFSFEFFDLAQNIQAQKAQVREQKPPVTISSQALDGQIVQYGRKGFGYITTDSRPERFWFHLTNVDEQGRQLLDNLLANSPQQSWLQNLSIPVSFEAAGYTRPDTDNPSAANVRTRRT